MSYDVWLEVDLGGSNPFEIYSRNHTSNTRRMWEAAGANIREYDGCEAGDCLAELAVAIREMRVNPDVYRDMLSPDLVWGTYESTLAFLVDLYNNFKAAPRAMVRVSY